MNRKEQKINIIIQARMGSTRFPGKILKPVMGRPLLSYQIERMRRIHAAHLLIVATTTDPKDDVLELFCKKENVTIFRGSEENVLDRYIQACRFHPADVIVRLTSDCPLLDPQIVDEAIQLFQTQKSSVDYVSNTQQRTFPRGMDVEVFSLRSLQAAAVEATKDFQREHVTPFLYEHPERFGLINFTHLPDASRYRLTVDTPEDFELITLIFEALYPNNKSFTLDDILRVLDQHPEWAKINAHIKQKEV